LGGKRGDISGLSNPFIKNEESPTPNPIVPLLCSFFLKNENCKISKPKKQDLPFNGKVSVELITKIEGFIDNMREMQLMV